MGFRMARPKLRPFGQVILEAKMTSFCQWCLQTPPPGPKFLLLPRVGAAPVAGASLSSLGLSLSLSRSVAVADKFGILQLHPQPQHFDSNVQSQPIVDQKSQQFADQKY